MLVDVLPVAGDRRRLALLQRDEPDPVLGRRRHGDALAGRGVDAETDVHLDLGGLGVGVLLPRECLDVAVALAVNVVDDPGLLALAEPRGPKALPDRHAALLL